MTSADEMLDQDHWTVARQRAAKWVWCPEVWSVMCDDPCAMANEHDRDCPCGSRYPLTITGDRAPQIRAHALQSAATWLAGESPYPQGVPFVLDTAERFATWIESGEDPGT